jgi:hypothetical protein
VSDEYWVNLLVETQVYDFQFENNYVASYRPVAIQWPRNKTRIQQPSLGSGPRATMEMLYRIIGFKDFNQWLRLAPSNGLKWVGFILPHTPDDGDSLRNVVFYCFLLLNTGRWIKSISPVVLYSICHRQNHLKTINGSAVGIGVFFVVPFGAISTGRVQLVSQWSGWVVWWVSELEDCCGSVVVTCCFQNLAAEVRGRLGNPK